MAAEKSQNVCWDNDIKFVLEVRSRPCLYDMTMKDYRNIHARQKAWEEIAEIMKVPVSACSMKWKTVRDRNVHIHRRSGSGAAGVREDPSWIVRSDLNFLKSKHQTKKDLRKLSGVPFPNGNGISVIVGLDPE